MARFAIAGFAHETNTFSPVATTYESFAERRAPFSGIIDTQVMLQFLEMAGDERINVASLGFTKAVLAKGHAVHPILSTSTGPSGLIPADVFDRIVGMITAGLAAEGPFDGVFLDLHGAMVFGEHEDGETEIIRRVRQVVGDIPVIASFDLHGNITQECVDLASALVGCRTYPHIDMYETGERCAALMLHLLDGQPIYKAYRQMPFLWPVSIQTTSTEPCQSIYAQIDDVEKTPGMLSGTIMAGFPAADLEHMGPTIFTYGTTQAAADTSADFLLDAIVKREGEFRSDLPDAHGAVRIALEASKELDKPVILADICDNAGGGATSDTVGILEALLAAGVHGAAVGLLYDIHAVEAAHHAGVGAEIELGLGGKLVPGHKPYQGVFKVVKLHEGEFNGSNPMNAGLPLNLGKMAQISIEGVHIVVSSVRTQANDRQMFEIVGVHPEDMKIVVLKSANHYRADFEQIAGEIIPFEAPGANIENPENAVYKNLRKGVRLQGLGRNHQYRGGKHVPHCICRFQS